MPSLQSPSNTDPVDSPCLLFVWSLPTCSYRQQSPWAGTAHPYLLPTARVCSLSAAACSLSTAVHRCPSLSFVVFSLPPVPAPCTSPPAQPCLSLLAPYLFLLIPARFLLIVASSLPIHGCSSSAAALLTSSPLVSTCLCPPGACPSVPAPRRSPPSPPRSDTCWPPLAEPGTRCSGALPAAVPAWGKGLAQSRCCCARRVPWRTERLAVRAGGVPRARCWHGSGKEMPGVKAPVLNSLTAGSRWGWGPWEQLVTCAKSPSGTTVVLDGDKSHSPPYSSSPHLANCLSSTFLAYLPTPRELWDDGRPHVGQRPA